MAKNKLQELVDSLTMAEKKQFQSWLLSPFFNCSKPVLKIFNAISGEKYEGNKQLLCNVAFPGEKYNDKLMRYYLTELHKNLEYYFTLKELGQQPLTLKVLTAKALTKRDCEKSFTYIHNEIIKGSRTKDAGHFMEQFNHAEQFLTYTSGKQKRKTLPDYSSTLLNLDSFYIAKKLQLNCEVVNLSNILKKSYEISLSSEIKELAQKEPFARIPVIRIYYHILESLTAGTDESHFTTLESLLKKHGSLFHPSELGDMYQYLKNYCVRKINQGNAAYIRRLYNIYITMLQNKPLMRNDYLSQWEFKNIVSISLRLNEKKWCEQFIERYINYLKPGERKNALAYNLAYSAFMDDDYRKAIRKLQEVELTDVFYQLDARVILLKCYFELDEYDTFFYHSSAFRLFLLRNRTLSDYQKTINRNLIKFLSAIMRAASSKAKLRKIKTEIEQEKNVADLNWLLNKVTEAGG
jgi:hypothetical protein